jgi:hypothetical protein
MIKEPQLAPNMRYDIKLTLPKYSGSKKSRGIPKSFPHNFKINENRTTQKNKRILLYFRWAIRSWIGKNKPTALIFIIL